MQRLIYFLISIVLLSAIDSHAQTDYKTKRLLIKKSYSRNIRQIDDKFAVSLQNIENPFEGNSTYRQHLQDLKAEVARKFPPKKMQYSRKNKAANSNSEVDTSQTLYAFEGNKYNFSVPNDNTMAANKDGIVLSAINTNIIFYDTKSDSLLKTVSLNVFSDTLSVISTHQYDPKVIYDYQYDRFIVVNLAGASSDNTSHIVVAFQQTDDVLGPWSYYAVEGNPLGDTSWTDFPAISLSNDELFITGNLLRYGGSWQTSFKQSVIWQLDKKSGFEGKDVLPIRLYHDIEYNGVRLRNIHPVMGGDAFFGPEMFFMSNKNFALTSDTFFLINTSGLLDDPATTLDVNLIKSDAEYGAPPNPKMPANKRLATNDARVLGAIYQNDIIHFVGNTLDQSSGFATIYHGIIRHPEIASTASLYLLQSDSLQFGYPNISFCGNEFFPENCMISFNYTSDSINPGFAMIMHSEDHQYSTLKVLKEGETYMNVLFGTLQRWGDYSGSQPVYGEPGKVWLCGTYGKLNPGQRVYGTWVSCERNPQIDRYQFVAKEDKMDVFPNPSVSERVYYSFKLENSGTIDVDLISMDGKIIHLMKDYASKEGVNILHFNTQYLGTGQYVLKVKSSDGKIFTKNLAVL